MSHTPPRLIAINHDDHYAEHVGYTADGRQFFLTTPFEPATDGRERREFIALYLFDRAGKILDAKIDDLGPAATLDRPRRKDLYLCRLVELGLRTYQRIEVQPFEVERFGVRFGLIARPSLDGGDAWQVTLEPGNYMAFHEPWDSGWYDT